MLHCYTAVHFDLHVREFNEDNELDMWVYIERKLKCTAEKCWVRMSQLGDYEGQTEMFWQVECKDRAIWIKHYVVMDGVGTSQGSERKFKGRLGGMVIII